MVEGFVLVDKPGGWTSHDVVARCRRLFGIKRIGHAGTLDPMATGLLILGLGRATRLIRFVQAARKTYQAVAVFGVSTDTLDADGAILTQEPMDVTEDDVRAAAERFVGRISQVPPMVSAIKVDGRRLYELAREGQEIEREARPVDVYSIEIEDVSPGAYPEVSMRVECGAGTYIRVLADDIASALGGRAHLVGLRRTAIGIHDVTDAWTMEALEEAAAAEKLADAVLTSAAGLADLPEHRAEGEVERAVRHGATFTAGVLDGEGLYRVLDPDGALLAVYRSDGRIARPEVVMA